MGHLDGLNLILPALVFLTGLIFGSFANVLIYRIPRGESVAFPPSKCTACGERIRPYDNIPVLSYVLLRGKCRNCASRISPVYPVVELSSAILFTGMFYKFGFTDELLSFIILAFTLLVISVIDIERRIIPNVLTLFLAAVGALAAMFNGSLTTGIAWAVGIFVFFMALALVKPGSIGMGDVKLSFVVGLFLNQLAVIAMFFAFLLGSVISVILMLVFNKTRKDQVPFAPFIAAGSMLAVFYGQPVIDWYLTWFPS